MWVSDTWSHCVVLHGEYEYTNQREQNVMNNSECLNENRTRLNELIMANNTMDSDHHYLKNEVEDLKARIVDLEQLVLTMSGGLAGASA